MRIFFDSSVLIAHLGGDPAARGLVAKVAEGEWIGFINPVVVSETLVGFLRLATGLSSRRIRERLARGDPPLLDPLSKVTRLLELFLNLPVEATPGELVETMKTYRLMPNDALIAITCRRYSLTHIATFDRDFERVPWLATVASAAQG